MNKLKWKKLKKLKRQYNDEKKGYHQRQYDILGNTMAIVVELRSDESAVKTFLKFSGNKNRPTKSKKTEEWLTAAVVAYVTGAKSENAIKLAWKRARVLDHLHDVDGIPPEKIADAIRSRRGIEAIAKEAARENPRRPRDEKGKEEAVSAAKKSPFKFANTCKESTGDNADEAGDWDGPGDVDDPPAGGDSQIVARISSALHAKLMAIKPKRRVKIIGVRIKTDDWTDCVLEVQDVSRLKD
jgi:hypothetical protein